MKNRIIDEDKIKKMLPFLDERQKRIYLASEAESLGHGGITAVSKASQVSRVTITYGMKELAGEDPGALSPSEGRQRRAGAGRPSIEKTYPGIKEALDKLVGFPDCYGNPENPLRWTLKSLRKLSEELEKEGYKVSHRVVGELLKDMGFSLQQNKKLEQVGEEHPDRGAQFDYINSRVLACQHAGDPTISVDCKKKEIIGNYKNAGSEWHEKGKAPSTKDHEFLWGEKAAPYAVYDMLENEGFVNVGISSDTAEFAVNTIRYWWRDIGSKKYAGSRHLLITADGGGSNGSRNRLWKRELQAFANETGLEIEVVHFPPGTSKWNKIEHCLFSQITRNWRGRPLESIAVILNLIAATTTSTGLKVVSIFDDKQYATGIKVSDEEMLNLNIERNEFHGEWNYTIKPQSKMTT